MSRTPPRHYLRNRAIAQFRAKVRSGLCYELAEKEKMWNDSVAKGVLRRGEADVAIDGLRKELETEFYNRLHAELRREWGVL